MPGRFWFLLVLLCCPVFSVAQVYKWTDENGVVHYGDERPPAEHQSFRYQGYTEIESAADRRVQRSIRNDSWKAPVNRGQGSAAERRQQVAAERAAKALTKRCEDYVIRMDHIDSRLRAGGYSASLGNRLRAERRELFGKRARECLRNGVR